MQDLGLQIISGTDVYHCTVATPCVTQMTLL